MTTIRTTLQLLAACAAFPAASVAQAPRAPAPASQAIVLRPARVFDGTQLQTGWEVVVTGDRITAAGPAGGVTPPAGARVIELR